MRVLIISVFLGTIFFTGQFLLSVNLPLGLIMSSKIQSHEEKKVFSSWNPLIPQVGGVSTSNFSLSARSALSYELTDEKMVFAKNINEKLPMASLTKIMTAYLALEEGIDKRYRVSSSAALIGENVMGLSEGEILTLEELLYGLMLPSGNDAAEVIAEGSPYGRDGFVEEMNKRAKQLGLGNTHFTNPSGLEGDGDQVTTVVDLLKLTKTALENKNFLKVVSTYEKELPNNNEHKYYRLFNDTNLLTSYPGVKGVKTGFTWEAGLCLVTYLEHNGHKIIAVILNSQNRRQEMKDLLDYTLIELGETPPKHE